MSSNQKRAGSEEGELPAGKHGEGESKLFFPIPIKLFKEGMEEIGNPKM